MATVEIDLTDPARPTVSHGTTVAAGRHLPTVVYLPADAAGRPLGARLPWVVFLHGYQSGAATYDALLRTWARSGYAVAAPTLPLTSDQSGATADEADMVNEPADVTFVITALLHRSGRGAGKLAGRLDPDHIGVAGHSDGANVAFVSGFSRRFRDPRVHAVMDLSGELPTGMGPFDHDLSGPPLLMIASDTDQYFPFSHSQQLFDAGCCTAWWVELHGAAHEPPFAGQAPWTPVVERVTVDFLDLTLGGRTTGPDRLVADANAPPTATLQASRR